VETRKTGANANGEAGSQNRYRRYTAGISLWTRNQLQERKAMRRMKDHFQEQLYEL